MSGIEDFGSVARVRYALVWLPRHSQAGSATPSEGAQ
jgi:hypothetical protein